MAIDIVDWIFQWLLFIMRLVIKPGQSTKAKFIKTSENIVKTPSGQKLFPSNSPNFCPLCPPKADRAFPKSAGGGKVKIRKILIPFYIAADSFF